MDIDNAWSQFKDKLRFEMPSKAFKDYVEPVTFLGVEEKRITLSVPSERASEWIQARLKAEILNHYHGHFPDGNGELKLELVVDEKSIPPEKEEREEVGADDAWKSLLASLQGTPIEVPGAWEDETSARWDTSGDYLVVSVPPSTDSDWLEKKFLPVAKIFFAQDHHHKSLLLEQQEGAGHSDLLVKVQRGAYEEIVQPNKIVPVQIYMFHHWLPFLSASPFWVVIAMRQASFVNKAESASIIKPISSRSVARWTPLRHVQVMKWINKDGFSSWFFKKTKDSKDSYEEHPSEYKVWSQIPVAPHHLAWIENYLKDHSEGGTAAPLLKFLLDRTGEIRRLNPGDMDLPDSYKKERRTLVDIVSDIFPGQLSQRVYGLIKQLENQITRPNLSITIPHYFFRKYMDELTSNEAALIWYLRSLYKANQSNKVKFTGYATIRRALGCGNRTPKRLLENCMLSEEDGEGAPWNTHYTPSLSLSNWLSAQYLGAHKNGTAREYEIKIRSNEPIHEDDQKHYSRLTMKLYEKFRAEEEARLQDKDNLKPTQNRTKATHYQNWGTQKETEETQTKTSNPRKTEHLNESNSKEHFNTFSKNHSIQPQHTQPNRYDSKTPSNNVGVGEVNMEKLLGFGSYSQYEKQKIKKLLSGRENVFLAWVLRNYITDAKFPVRLAVRNIEEGNNPEGYYLEIASLGWGSIQDIIQIRSENLDLYGYGDLEGENGEAVQTYRELSDSAKGALKDLKRTRFRALFEQV